jgi:hypothetical protein
MRIKLKKNKFISSLEQKNKLLKNQTELTEENKNEIPTEDEDVLIMNDSKLNTIKELDTTFSCLNITPLCIFLLKLGKYDGELALFSKYILFEGEPKSHHFQFLKNDQETNLTAYFGYYQILEIHKRRYLLQDVALEIFFTNGNLFKLKLFRKKYIFNI